MQNNMVTIGQFEEMGFDPRISLSLYLKVKTLIGSQDIKDLNISFGQSVYSMVITPSEDTEVISQCIHVFKLEHYNVGVRYSLITKEVNTMDEQEQKPKQEEKTIEQMQQELIADVKAGKFAENLSEVAMPGCTRLIEK